MLLTARLCTARFTNVLTERIAKIRKELKLTQEDVEERSIINGEKTIKYKTLSLIEQGYGEPKITTINLIAEALGVNISYLLNFENDKINVSKQDLINDIIINLNHLDILKLNIIKKQIEAIQDINSNELIKI